jgi:DNA-binding transcriptional regulator YiaG
MFKMSIEQFVLIYTGVGDMSGKYERIRELREDADLTQEKIGRAINVPQRSYAYYESGHGWFRRTFCVPWRISMA